MSVQNRQQLILEHLSDRKKLSAQELCELTGASEATIRRDLSALEEKGLLMRTYGGARAVVQGRTISEKAGAPDPYLANKTRVARTAARLIREGDTVFLGAGMTCRLLAREIKYKTNIKVITTSIDVINELADAPEVRLFLVGGDVYVGDNCLEVLGEYTHQYLAQLYLGKTFVTVDGISMEHGYSIVNHRQIPLYQYLLSNSREFYLLAAGHKFNKRYYSHLWSIQRVPNLVTDDSVDERYLRYFHNAGIRCYCDRR